MIRPVAHIKFIHVTQRDKIWPHSLAYDWRSLYIDIDTQVGKALGLIFRRSNAMYTRHIWLQIAQGKSCWMYLEFLIVLVTSTTSRAFSVNVNWLILLDVQILNSRHYGLYWKWGKATILIVVTMGRLHHPMFTTRPSHSCYHFETCWLHACLLFCHTFQGCLAVIFCMCYWHKNARLSFYSL